MQHVIGLLLIGWLGAMAFFWGQIPGSPPVDITADAIVVFTGGKDRVHAGLQLLNQNRGQKLLISGVKTGVQFTDLFDKTVDPTRVTLDYRAQNTQTNVDETKAWVQQHGFQKILLVTADYHLPRAMLLLQQQMPDVEIIPYPVVVPNQFWRFFRECHKYLLTRLKQVVAA